jgi:hypothetical protein
MVVKSVSPARLVSESPNIPAAKLYASWNIDLGFDSRVVVAVELATVWEPIFIYHQIQPCK